MKKLLEIKLKFFAKAIIKKYQPKIIAITGSVGKTSSTNAIFSILSYKFKTAKNLKNYNNEIGLPLSIIGEYSPERNILGWILVFYKALKMLLVKVAYPEYLVLEMGADKPNDLSYLLKIAPNQVGVLTAISPVHLSNFENLDQLKNEKYKVIRNLKEKGTAILNNDDEEVIKIIPEIKGELITYGIETDAVIKAQDIAYSGLEQALCDPQSQWDCNEWGTSFTVSYKEDKIPIFLLNALGKQHVYAALAAVAVGISQNMNLVEISNALKTYIPEPGRMNLIKGIKSTLIIDDTYNAAPKALVAAISVLNDIKLEKGRKIAILGEMRELGNLTEDEHIEIGKQLALNGIDFIVGVGDQAKHYITGAVEAGLSNDKTKLFNSSDEAKRFVQDLIQENDLILIKGSQGTRMEKVTKEIMAEPQKAKDLLVRQSESWLNR